MQSPTLELKDTMVRAGAGAGKTTGLVNQVIEVYRRYRAAGLGAPRIVLTTFTRKATQELKERLILRAVTEKDADLLQFVSDPSRLHISTIHGLLNMFLKQVGHLAGLDAGFQIVSTAEGDHLARLALREVLVEQGEALSWLEVYGFQRVLQMCRAFQTFELEQGELRPAGLEEIESAARERLRYWSNAFHMLSADILESTDEDSWVCFAKDIEACVKAWDHSLPDLETFPSKPRRSKKQAHLEHLHEVAEKICKSFKDEMKEPAWQREFWPRMVESWAAFTGVAAEFSRVLRRMKNDQARFEMNDLELKSIEILRANPFLSTVFREAWDFFMIDEYQDTSPLQVEILTALIGEKPKYLVGDPQQSIYLFRGAEVGVFFAAEKSIQESGGNSFELTKNYRSEPNLLLWINEFMATIGDSFMRMQPRTEPEDASEKACVTFFRAADPAVEGKGLVARIHQLLSEGASLEQICVISRTHRGLMEISQTLKEYGYPTHVHSARGFTTRREVIDAQALWKFLANPHDNLNLLILLRSPWFMVEDWQLAEWMKDRPQSLWRRLESLERIPDAILRLRDTQRLLVREGMVRAFEKSLCANAFVDLSLHNDPAGRKESNLWKLIHKAQALEKEGGSSILDLMEANAENPLDATEGDATSAQEPNCINLMTIHGSKGLEFDHVIIPRMHESPVASHTAPFSAENGIYFFPIWDDDEGRFVASTLDTRVVKQRREREAQEYGRWLYVALTRAKKSLTLSWSGAGRDSWVECSPWFKKLKGLYKEKDYCYEVVEEMPDPQAFVASSQATLQVREPYSAKVMEMPDARFSVTDLLEKPEKPMAIADLLRRGQAQAAGTRIHRALEALKYGGAVSDQDDEAVRYVLALEEPPLREFIRTGQTEWGFQIQTQSRVIEGQIDLWAEHHGTLYVVDYKSGSMKEIESAFKQLTLYAWALRRFGHKEPIKMAVVYPLKQTTKIRDFNEELFLAWEVELGRP